MSYIAKAFTDMITTKLVINAGNILRKNGYENVDLDFGVKVREDRYFQATIMCGEFVFVVPEFDLYTDIVNESIDKNTEDYIEDFGSFVAHEYMEFVKHKNEGFENDN